MPAVSTTICAGSRHKQLPAQIDLYWWLPEAIASTNAGVFVLADAYVDCNTYHFFLKNKIISYEAGWKQI